MHKCDHPECSDKAKWYGYQQCYFVCDAHVDWGLEIELHMMKEMEEALLEPEQ